jgi:hypothetical protein
VADIKAGFTQCVPSSELSFNHGNPGPRAFRLGTAVVHCKRKGENSLNIWQGILFILIYSE